MLVERGIAALTAGQSAVIFCLEIGAGAKGTAFAGNHQRARVFQLVQRDIDIVRHAKRTGVEPLRLVERDRRDLIGDGELDIFEFHMRSFCFPLP